MYVITSIYFIVLVIDDKYNQGNVSWYHIILIMNIYIC